MCVCVCMCVCVYVYVGEWMHFTGLANTAQDNPSKLVNIYMCVCVLVDASVCVCVYVCMCMCVCCVCVCMCMWVSGCTSQVWQTLHRTIRQNW